MKKILMLKKNYQFRKVLYKGKHYFGKILDIVIIKNNCQKNYIGIAINSRFAKAVKRNRLKRLIKEGYRKIDKNVAKGYSLVFLCKKSANIDDINFKNIYEDIIEILVKAGIYNL